MFRILFKITFCCLLSFTFVTCSKEIPPNVIFILTDDQGYGDLGIYGASDVNTPNIDSIAKKGAYFTSYYSTQPVCSASRASILTGCYPDRLGVFNAYSPGSKVGLNPDETTIAELLKANGYNTAIFGKWHLGEGKNHEPTGFDFWSVLPLSLIHI